MTLAATPHFSRPNLKALVRALKALPPAGAEGFEGLLARVLSCISGQAFRLARSGGQGGLDGAAMTGIVFEAKRYDEKVPNDQIFSKVFQVGAGVTPPHLWILGATVEVGTQTLQTLRVGADRLGVGVLILDWPAASPFPPLALVCAMAAADVVAFFRERCFSEAELAEVGEALAAVQRADGFEAVAGLFTAELRQPALALPNALAANADLLRTAFNDRRQARSLFGQSLAPGAEAALPTRERDELVEAVRVNLLSAANGEIVALLGREGHGKSWLFAQAWLGMDSAPLTVVVPAKSLGAATPHGQVLPFLIGRLIEQTGDQESDSLRERWRRRIAAWEPRLEGEPPRFIVFIDGLNEQSELEWPRWLAKVSGFAADHGGVLAISTRQAFFYDRVYRELTPAVKPVQVPEWSDAELAAILDERGVDRGVISPAIFERLRNPRLLGIAFDLLGAGGITTFAELSVDRLLFEHIRAGGRDGAAPETVEQFVKRLAQHAQEVIERIRSQRTEDRLVFDQAAVGTGGFALTPALAAVTAEHFFRSLPEDPTLYTLAEDGLSLALGFSLVKALQRAERGGDVSEALGELIDPIAALDKTAEAVFSALVVASLDDRVSGGIRRALIIGLLGLQNLEPDRYPAFVNVVRHTPDSALGALEDLAVRRRPAASQDWIPSALRDCRYRPDCWRVIAEHADRWLRTYSLDPALNIFQRQADEPEAYAQRLTENTEKLAADLGSLPKVERDYLATALIRNDRIDPGDLHRHAFALIAGMPLAGFADSLVACAYSTCLHSSHHAPNEEYRALARFNTVDWSQARTALLEASSFLTADTASRNAKWARVEVLRCTATLYDAEEEDSLVSALTSSRERFKGGRLVELYSPADPCDPEAVQEGDLSRVLNDLRELDVAAVSVGNWMRQADHFLEDAAPALARFAPEAAIKTYRRIARTVLDRPSEQNRIAVTSLRAQSAVFDTGILERLQVMANDMARPDYDAVADRDAWLMSQFALLMLLPHLHGEEQVAVLSSLPPQVTYLTSLTDVFAPCRPDLLDRWITTAIDRNEHSQITLALVYARGSGTPLSPSTWARMDPLLSHETPLIRALAIGLLANTEDHGRLAAFARSDWSAGTLDPRKDFYEIWFGSWVLIRAAERSMIDPAAIVARVGPGLYAHIATRFGAAVHKEISDRLEAAVSVLLTAALPNRPPAVELAVSEATSPQSEPPRYSLSDREPKANNLKAFARRLDESDEEFQAKQKKAWSAFGVFESALSRENARLAVEDVGFAGADAVVVYDPDRALALARLIRGAHGNLLPGLANFGLMLARAISGIDPDLAQDLFERLDPVRPYLRLTFGRAAVSLNAASVWRSDGTPLMDKLRRQRLDAAGDDHALALEVLAALDAGRQGFIETYAAERIAEGRPVEIGRGLMVLGFGGESATTDRILEEFAEAKGMIGRAAKAARYAYARNRWARIWRDRLVGAETPEDVWRYSVLLDKIVDGRALSWSPPPLEGAARARRFLPTFEHRIKRRVDRWKQKREGTFLGGPVPADYLIASERD